MLRLALHSAGSGVLHVVVAWGDAQAGSEVYGAVPGIDDESRAIALAAYQEGATPLLSVLEAQRTRAEVRQQYFRTLFDYQTSLSELELAVGKEIQP